MNPPVAAISASSGAQESFPEGPIRIGSDAHKTLFCRTLLDTFNPYKPAVIDWPELDSQARDRLVSLPIWDIAVQTEGRARLNVASFAAVTSDPLLRTAIELNAFEEGRHKHVLSNLVAAYGIALAPEPHYVVQGDPEWAFMVTGYSECIDSFFAFGLFESAKRSGSARRHVRARHPGGSPSHPVLRQLGCVASPHHAALAPTILRAEGVGRVAVTHLGAHRHRPRCGQRRTGQQFHHERGEIPRR